MTIYLTLGLAVAVGLVIGRTAVTVGERCPANPEQAIHEPESEICVELQTAPGEGDKPVWFAAQSPNQTGRADPSSGSRRRSRCQHASVSSGSHQCAATSSISGMRWRREKRPHRLIRPRTADLSQLCGLMALAASRVAVYPPRPGARR
jgi:streptogramin lyase